VPFAERRLEGLDASVTAFRGGGCGGFFEDLDFPAGSVVMQFDGCRYEMPYLGDLKPSRSGWSLYPIGRNSALLLDR
jgi:hypothetical protein